MSRTLTGWHVLGIFVGCFSIIIAVNLTLAFQAVATFPGIVTKNSYVASQKFDADKAAQDALGWTVTAQVTQGELILAVRNEAGAEVRPDMVTAVLGRATHVADDIEPQLVWDGQNFRAAVDVAAGYWTLWLNMTAADGTAFRRRIPLDVLPGGSS